MPEQFDANLEATLEDITTRLVQRFAQHDPVLVHETVHRFAGEFGDARVWDFVPLFVERSSVQHLKALAPGQARDSVDA